MDLPSPETLRAYETLGTVGILLLVLASLAGAVAIFAVWFGRNLVGLVNKLSDYAKNFASAHLQAMEEQTQTMNRIEVKQEQIAKTQTDWNRMLMCYLPNCPIKRLLYENNIPVENDHVQPGVGGGHVVAPSAPVDKREH